MGAKNMEPRKHLPRYNVALGPSQTTHVAPPPFNFPGVTARIFPLRASLNLLSGFCQSYLNVAPGTCELQPYLPYVLLVVLDYGRMAIEEFNMGWVSQHEVLFEVPLGMWRRDRLGCRKFVKWVVNVPFIVVDNPSSLTTGREVYGWPKVLGRMKGNSEGWLTDPRKPLRLLTLDVRGLSSVEPDVRLLEITQRVSQNAALAPPDLGLIDPFERLSRMSRAVWSIGFDLGQLFLGAPLAGFGRQTPADRREVLFDSLRQLSGFFGNPGLDVVTLKQFRDTEDPAQVCYQSLVESRLSIARYNRGGLLGLDHLLRGDITGGFRIRLHENPAFPIVQSLGLEVIGERSQNGRTVSLLEPFFPFWMSVDLTYGRGETICWRLRNEPWYRETTPVSARPPLEAREVYNTFAGAAQQVWQSPFLLPEASFDVFPLPAKRVRFKIFLTKCMNFGALNLRLGPGEHFSFKPVGEHVYMVVSRNRIFSAARSAAWIESCQLAFYVPLLLCCKGAKRLVLATPFAFVDNPTLAMTMREVQGVPAIEASIEAPSRFWERDGPLLRMDLDVFTALEAGLRSERRTLLEVVRGAPAQPLDGGAPPLLAAPTLLNKTGGPVTLERMMFKQFRDVTEPNRACYQALVLEPWTFSQVKSMTWLEDVAAVRIYRYPSHPLVEKLGLMCGPMVPPEESAGAIADVIQPEKPFRITLSIEIGHGAVLAHTAGFLPWKINDLAVVGLRQREGIEGLLKEIEECLKQAGHDLLQPLILALHQNQNSGGAA